MQAKPLAKEQQHSMLTLGHVVIQNDKHSSTDLFGQLSFRLDDDSSPKIYTLFYESVGSLIILKWGETVNKNVSTISYQDL